jgi:hypothetical protein
MKKLLIAVGLAALVSSANAQGLINFLNNATTLVTLRDGQGNNLGSTPNVAGQYYFQLFVAPAGTATDGGAFVGTIYGTNQASAGRFSGGVNVGVAGAPAGSSRAILVRGWSASYGADYATALAAWTAGTPGFLGSSAIAPNFVLGGFDGTGTIPTSPAFGGAFGIGSGFALSAPVPEPSSIALAGLGAASLLLFRRRK